MCRTNSRRSFAMRGPIALVGALLLLGAPITNAHGQTGAPPARSTPWNAWAFVRLGGASGAPGAVATSGGGVLTSLGGGVAASHGMLLGMIRVTDSQQLLDGPGVRDDALLAGLRSPGRHAFIAGAIGVDRATAFETSDTGTSTRSARTALAYDFTAHTDFRVGGLALAVAGVVGPPRTSYVALTLGAELGWFGR